MYPPPPIPFIHGSTTPAVKAVVTAASTAFPPRRRMSAPAAAACSVLAATIPPRPRASSRLTCHSVSTGIARPSSRVSTPPLADHRRPALCTELKMGIDKRARRVYVQCTPNADGSNLGRGRQSRRRRGSRASAELVGVLLCFLLRSLHRSRCPSKAAPLRYSGAGTVQGRLQLLRDIRGRVGIERIRDRLDEEILEI